jgi:hypothetical protein
MGTVITNGPSAATAANAIAAAGPIMDYVGMSHATRRKLQECKVLLNSIDTDTDSTDSSNKTLVANLKLALT